VILSALAGLLVVVPLATIKLAYAENEFTTAATDNKQASRVLHFPKNRSVGVLYIATEKENELWDKYSKAFDYRRDWAWKSAGQAHGDVVVPAGAVVKINLKQPGAANMSWVERLDPDDIYEVRVYPHPSSPKAFKFGDAQVRHLGHLTGLRELELMYVQVTGRGLRALEPLKSLKKLTIYSPDAGNDSLQSIGKLTGLQSLILGNGKWDDKGLAYLADLKDLEEINLPFSGVPGKGFDAMLQLPRLKYIAAFAAFKNAHLARLKKSHSLRALNLNSNVTITNDSLRYIAQLPQLEYLDLFKTNITDAGLKHLRPLKSLKRLNIQVNRQGRKPTITALGVAAVAELPEMETLRMGNVGDANECLKLLSNLKNLKSLGIGGRRDTGLISDEGVRHLTKLHNMEQLNLWGTALTNAGAAHLSQLTSLTSLTLQSSGISDDGLESLAKLQELRYLDLMSLQKQNGITTAGLSRLKGLTKLTDLKYVTRNSTSIKEPLDFSGFPELQWLLINGLRDEDLVSLGKCEKLKRLELGLEGPITDEGLSHLAGLRHLEMLTIPGEGITDEGLVHLAEMEQLDMLNIRGHITDAGLHQLAQYKTLGSVTINTTQSVSPAAIKQLHNSLPNLWMFSINQTRAGIDRPKRKPLRSGKQAPPFQLTLLDGSEISLKDFRGKVVLLYFWSTSCKPCVASFPKLKKVYKNLSKYQDFAMIGLSGDDNELIWKNFVEKHELTWPQARIGDNSKMATAYGVAGFPRYIVIGRDGTILASEAAQVGTALQKALEDHEE
ncbi:redoxin family protein, partial [Symmachiella dynata]|uniref:redoxin family protein n=1 Tax=Symmachiella dynata TaxID=2527995 RepID=UPI0030ED7DE2